MKSCPGLDTFLCFEQISFFLILFFFLTEIFIKSVIGTEEQVVHEGLCLQILEVGASVAVP